MLNKTPPPGGAPGAGGAYQHFAEIVGALRAQVFSVRLRAYCFLMDLGVSRIGSLEIGGERPSGDGG
jgi:hypothetical protein